MTTHTIHKLNVNMPAGREPGLRRAASPSFAIGAGVTGGSLADGLKR